MTRWVILATGLVVMGDALRQIATALEYAHVQGVAFGTLDLWAGAVLVEIFVCMHKPLADRR